MSYDYDVVEDIPVYASVETADAYLIMAIHGQSWTDLDDEVKGQALVTATRTLDRQQWKGEPAETSPLQALDWPRINTGVIGVYDNEIPIDIVHASIEMALMLTQGASIQTEGTVSQKISSLKAGSVSISYFGGQDVTTTQRFPTIIDELLGPYLLGGGGASTAANNLGSMKGVGQGASYGTDGVSQTDQDYGVTDGM